MNSILPYSIVMIAFAFLHSEMIWTTYCNLQILYRVVRKWALQDAARPNGLFQLVNLSPVTSAGWPMRTPLSPVPALRSTEYYIRSTYGTELVVSSHSNFGGDFDFYNSVLLLPYSTPLLFYASPGLGKRMGKYLPN